MGYVIRHPSSVGTEQCTSMDGYIWTLDRLARSTSCAVHVRLAGWAAVVNAVMKLTDLEVDGDNLVASVHRVPS